MYHMIFSLGVKGNMRYTVTSALPLPPKETNCRSKTDTERQNLGHIVEQRIKNFGGDAL